MPKYTHLAIAITPHGAVFSAQPDSLYAECELPDLSLPQVQPRRRSVAREQRAAARLGAHPLPAALAAT